MIAQAVLLIPLLGSTPCVPAQQAGTAPLQDQMDGATTRPALLFFHARPQTGGERQALGFVREHLAGQVTIRPLALASLGELAGPQAGESPRLQAYAVMRRQDAAGYALVEFQRTDAILRLEIFDGRLGVRARRGVKMRSLGSNELSEEHLGWLRAMLEALSNQLEERREIARRSSIEPYHGKVLWHRGEVPPVVGFRWKFSPAGPRVTFVYEGSSIAEAGLSTGDLLVGVNGRPVPTPPLLGRAIGPLRAGAPLRLRVERAGKPIDLVGKVESAAELVPAWQKGVLGRPLREILAPEPLPYLGTGEIDGRLLLILVFSPRMPDTWDCVAVLRRLAEHYGSEQIGIVGLARGASEAEVDRFTKRVRPGWPAIADPEIARAGALHVWEPPELLLVDAAGVLRFRQIPEERLGQAVETLLDREH